MRLEVGRIPFEQGAEKTSSFSLDRRCLNCLLGPVFGSAASCWCCKVGSQLGFGQFYVGGLLRTCSPLRKVCCGGQLRRLASEASAEAKFRVQWDEIDVDWIQNGGD